MTPLGWGWAGFVWGYALLWFLVNDRVKLLAYRVFDPRKAKSEPDAKSEPKSDVKPEAEPEAKGLPQNKVDYSLGDCYDGAYCRRPSPR
jgi:H+-transporting ATPase